MFPQISITSRKRSTVRTSVRRREKLRPPPWFHLSCRFVPKCWDTARRRRRYCRCLYELYIYCVGRGEKETYGCILWFTTPSIAKHEISSFAASTVGRWVAFFCFCFLYRLQDESVSSKSLNYIHYRSLYKPSRPIVQSPLQQQ